MTILGTIASAITGNLYSDPGAMFPLQSAAVTSGGTASITFSNIPNTYAHLQVRILSKTSESGTGNAANTWMRINGDTGANYTYHRISGDGASAGALGGTGLTACAIGSSTPQAGLSNIFGVYVVDILDYANTNKFKTVRSLTGCDQNGNGIIWFGSNAWLSTSAITSLTFYTDANLPQYTSFALYGIKGA